jgi:O-antigen ligase
VVAGAIALQIVPIPVWLVSALSPGTDEFLRTFDVSYRWKLTGVRQLSLAPDATGLALLAFIAFATLIFGASVAVARYGPRRIAEGVIFTGGVLALVAIAQKATFNGRLYWFWEPQFSSQNAFGPFVNRNHCAGWLLMAAALSLGYLYGRLSRPGALGGPGWRRRLLWLATPDASRLLLATASIAAMILAIVWTMSRSGMIGLTVAAGVIGVQIIRRSRARGLGLARVWLIPALLGIAVAWRGPSTLLLWFDNTSTLHWRFGVWRDALGVIRDFPLVGTGLNAFGTAMHHYQSTPADVHVQQAHNDYLQLAAEGGLLVLVPVCFAVWVVVREIRRRFAEPQGTESTYWIRVGAVAALCGIAVQETVEFSLQMPGNAALFAVICGIALHRAPVPRDHEVPLRAALPALGPRRAGELTAS